MPSFDDFAHGFDPGFALAPPLRLCPFIDGAAKAAATGADRVVPDAPPRPKPNAQAAFGTRYDFGASLSAAIQAASSTLGDRSGLSKKDDQQAKPQGQDRRRAAPKPADLARDKPPLQSQSYNDLIDKYCFFGSAKASSPSMTKPAAPPTSYAPTTFVPTANAPSAASVPAVASPPVTFQSSPSASPEQDPTPAEPRDPQPPSAAATTTNATSTSSNSSSRISRSPSPATGSGLGSRTTSPVSFGYPYRNAMGQLGGFADGCAPTAIKG